MTSSKGLLRFLSSVATMFLLVLPLLAWAQHPIDGTWKLDVKATQFPQKPIVMLLQNGVLNCESCVPPANVKADGQWQKVAGYPEFDMMMVKVVDANHVERATKKDGKDVGSSTSTISDDGKTMTIDWVDKSSPTGKVVTGKTTLTRVAAGPAGSHAYSGSWRAEHVEDPSQQEMLFIYKSTADGMDYSSSEGEAYSAKFDGKYVPVKGVPGDTMVSIKKLGANVLEETYQREGKIISVSTLTVDGKKLSVEYADKQQGTTMKLFAVKQ